MTTADDPTLAELLSGGDAWAGVLADYLADLGATLPEALLLFRGEPPHYQGGIGRRALAEYLRRVGHTPPAWEGGPPLPDAVEAVPAVVAIVGGAPFQQPPLRFDGYFSSRQAWSEVACDCGGSAPVTFSHAPGRDQWAVLRQCCKVWHWARHERRRAPDVRDFKRRVLALFPGVRLTLTAHFTAYEWSRDLDSLEFMLRDRGLAFACCTAEADALGGVTYTQEVHAPDLIPPQPV